MEEIRKALVLGLVLTAGTAIEQALEIVFSMPKSFIKFPSVLVNILVSQMYNIYIYI